MVVIYCFSSRLKCLNSQFITSEELLCDNVRYFVRRYWAYEGNWPCWKGENYWKFGWFLAVKATTCDCLCWLLPSHCLWKEIPCYRWAPVYLGNPHHLKFWKRHSQETLCLGILSFSGFKDVPFFCFYNFEAENLGRVAFVLIWAGWNN